MSFISFTFFGCLAACGLIYYALPARLRVYFLLIASYGFYATWSPVYLVLLLATSGVVYWLGLQLAAATTERQRGLLLVAGLAAVGCVLFAYKAAGALHGVLLPLGLSYYSFKLLAYLIDVYWDEAQVERDPLVVFLYPAFFPQIVSGPIQRPDDFFSQLRRATAMRADYGQIEDGIRLILGGLMLKMLIGDRLAAFINIVEKAPGNYSWPILLTTIACYTLQLYADFSGYTNIAIGIGKIFGINSPPNFNAPFAASTIPEMWRRFHMSLTLWLTDYLFTPLHMALRNFGRAGLVLAIFGNMVSVGLWHGLSLNFLIFGVMHAVFLTVTVFTKRFREMIFGRWAFTRRLGYLLGCILTFCLMSFSQIFFHAPTFAIAWAHVDQLVGVIPSGSLTWTDIRTEVAEPLFLCMAIAYCVGALTPGARRYTSLLSRFIPSWLAYGVYLLLISALSIDAGTTFIYGQF